MQNIQKNAEKLFCSFHNSRVCGEHTVYVCVDFAFISQKLDEISLAVDSLNLWVDKTASENDLNVTLLREEKERLKKQK